MYMYICIYICIYINVYIHIHMYICSYSAYRYIYVACGEHPAADGLYVFCCALGLPAAILAQGKLPLVVDLGRGIHVLAQDSRR